MRDKKTTLAFDNQESEVLSIPVGIPQGSTLSPILLLFYNAELLDISNPTQTRVSSLDFVDDINMLAYGKSTEGNCKQLEEMHRRCLAWAKRFNTLFVPEKYIVMHFSRRRKFNIKTPIRPERVVKEPEKPAQALGVWLDPHLR